MEKDLKTLKVLKEIFPMEFPDYKIYGMDVFIQDWVPKDKIYIFSNGMKINATAK